MPSFSATKSVRIRSTHSLRRRHASMSSTVHEQCAPFRFRRGSEPVNDFETVRRERRPYLAGANPARQLSLQPVAVGAAEGGNDLG